MCFQKSRFEKRFKTSEKTSQGLNLWLQGCNFLKKGWLTCVFLQILLAPLGEYICKTLFQKQIVLADPIRVCYIYHKCQRWHVPKCLFSKLWKNPGIKLSWRLLFRPTLCKFTVANSIRIFSRNLWKLLLGAT